MAGVLPELGFLLYRAKVAGEQMNPVGSWYCYTGIGLCRLR